MPDNKAVPAVIDYLSTRTLKAIRKSCHVTLGYKHNRMGYQIHVIQ